MISEIVCKFHLENLMPVPGAPTEYPGMVVTLWASYDPTLNEDKRFSEATPSGRLEAHITNPSALEFFHKNDGSLDYEKDIYLILTSQKPE